MKHLLPEEPPGLGVRFSLAVLQIVTHIGLNVDIGILGSIDPSNMEAISEEGTVTGIENEPTLNSSSEGRTCIYDLLGRKIMSLGEYDLISTISLPTGVYIIQRGNQTERMVVK